MKKRILSGLFLLLTFSAAKAQTVFQGEIIYKATYKSARQEKPESPVEATVLFGKDRLRISIKEEEDIPKEVFLIFLDSGKVYTLSESEKTFNRRWLGRVPAPSAMSLSPRVIAGYSTHGEQDPSGNVSGYSGVLMSMSDRLFYISDSLYYPVPEAYALNPELMMIRKNHIVLGGLIEMRNRFWGIEADDTGMEESLAKDSIIIEAIAVKPGVVDPARFMVPADFMNEIEKYKKEGSDTTFAFPEAVTDTVVAKKPAAKTPVKKPVSKKPAPKKPAPTPKPAAIKPKQ